MEHWNIQINIQQVITEDVKPGAARGINQAISGQHKVTKDVLKLAVVADTEEDAYSKAHRMLFANQPNVEMTSR